MELADSISTRPPSAANGWDPNYRPDSSVECADVVSLGYVVNVIEDAEERRLTLQKAWSLANRLLIVSALVNVGGWGKTAITFGDGILTRIGTFQKEFSQSELRDYIERSLEIRAWPGAIGVFYVFKDDRLRETYQLNRYRRHAAGPRKRLSEKRFEQHRELLEDLIKRIAGLGRVPFDDEFERSGEIADEFGSVRRAYSLIKRVTGAEEWEKIGEQRAQDLLVYLALSRFETRPRYSQLSTRLQRDIKAFFGNYKRACSIADLLLFRSGDPEAIDDACKESSTGKLLPNALYVHRDAISALEPQLRIYEGCARNYVGEIEDANIVKIHRLSGKVSYLCYPNFDKDPHPALKRSFKVNLRTLEIDCYDYSESENPPILHRKETFLSCDHPLYEKFAKLTQEEEKHGLLDDASTIGTRSGWKTRLDESGFDLRGHKLIRAKS